MKVTNVIMYCDARTDVHIYTQTHTEKKYIYNNSYINCGNNKKNPRFYNNKFGSKNIGHYVLYACLMSHIIIIIIL